MYESKSACVTSSGDVSCSELKDQRGLLVAMRLDVPSWTVKMAAKMRLPSSNERVPRARKA